MIWDWFMISEMVAIVAVACLCLPGVFALGFFIVGSMAMAEGDDEDGKRIFRWGLKVTSVLTLLTTLGAGIGGLSSAAVEANKKRLIYYYTTPEVAQEKIVLTAFRSRRRFAGELFEIEVRLMVGDPSLADDVSVTQRGTDDAGSEGNEEQTEKAGTHLPPQPIPGCLPAPHRSFSSIRR